MKNITVAISDHAYRQARIRAAEQGRSVSSLVAEFLECLAGANDDFARRVALQQSVLSEITRFSAGDRLDRSEVHTRAIR